MNIKKRVKFLFTRAAFRNLSIHFLQVLGILWLFVEATSFFVDISQKKKQILLWFISIAFFWTIIRSFPPLKYAKKSRQINVEIEITVSNLLEEPSNIAFGCSDCFDTEPEVIVGPNSLIAQLVKTSFKGNHHLLDTRIAQSLAHQSIQGTTDSNKLFGKKVRYRLGTVAIVCAEERKAFLLAFSFTNKDRTTTTTKEDLWLSLCRLWETVKENGFLEPLAVPVFGSGLARFPASRISLIQLLLLSFVIATREAKVSKKLILVISEHDYDPAEMAEAIELLNSLDF